MSAEDCDLAVWAGVIPFHTVAGSPVPSPDLRDGIELPGCLREQSGNG